MNLKTNIWKDTAVIAIGQAVGAALLIGIFAMLGRFDLTVLLGGIAGVIIATANYFLMYFFASRAADKAALEQDIGSGQKLIQMSYMGRMIGLLVVLVLLAKSGWFHVITLAVPLAFNRPILTLYELLRKKGGASN